VFGTGAHCAVGETAITECRRLSAKPFIEYVVESASRLANLGKRARRGGFIRANLGCVIWQPMVIRITMMATTMSNSIGKSPFAAAGVYWSGYER